jgi:hypothetical protein
MTRHCGDLRIMPLFSKKNTAERVLLSARLGRGAQTKMYSGLDMNNQEVLRNGKSIWDIFAQHRDETR